MVSVISDHSIADRIKMSDDKKGQEMFSEDTDKILLVLMLVLLRWGIGNPRLLKLKRMTLHLTCFLNNLNLKKVDELNGVKFKNNTKNPPLGKQF